MSLHKERGALNLPGWRLNDLQKQLPQTAQLEEAVRIRSAADERLNEISRAANPANDAGPFVQGQTDPFQYLKDWLDDEVFNPPRPVRREPYSGVDDFPYGEPPYRQAPKAGEVDLSDFNPSHYLSRAIRGAVWADPAELKRAKELSKNLESITGVPMEVDHLIPLKGDFVSGLNTQDNLFVVPAVENRLKSNSFDYDDYKAIPANAHRLTKPSKHARFLADNRQLVKSRQAKKGELSGQFSEHLDRQIIDPTTQLGKNAKQLWGKDYKRYAEDIRKQIGLLGV